MQAALELAGVPVGIATNAAPLKLFAPVQVFALALSGTAAVVSMLQGREEQLEARAPLAPAT